LINSHKKIWKWEIESSKIFIGLLFLFQKARKKVEAIYELPIYSTSDR
jgi:hypothetical protein